MVERRKWRNALSSEERSKIRELERRIKEQEEIAEMRSRNVQAQRELVYLKYQRQVIQNRVTQRARRSDMAESA